MDVKIEPSWKNLLQPEFSKDYFNQLVSFVRQEYKQNMIFPPGPQIFNAFDHCPLDQVKVVIIGQDPYHGPGQAHGLCFSVNDGIAFPPSLRNIFQEINTDLNKKLPESGNLERWASQGVLLLNATLTVKAHSPGSHQNKGWESFTDRVIQLVSDHKQNVVFLLWGTYAQKKSVLIDGSKHLVLKAPHPSPFSANRGFFGCRHFSKTNQYLQERGLEPIDW